MTTITGAIMIDPPIPHHLLKGSKHLPGDATNWPDLLFHITKQVKETDEGTLTSIQAEAIQSAGYETQGRTAEAELRAIVKEFGEGRTFTGYLNMEGEENTDMWRLVVRNGVVERVDAVITWPGFEDSDG
jgi:hypothetical protein